MQIHDDLFKSTYLKKVVILSGDAGVGKTNLVSRFVKGNDQVAQNISPTIGVQFATKLVKLNDGRKIKTQIWDTAGQEQYRAITMAHYRRALGALVVYDITKERSFQNLPRWIDSIREQADQNVVIVIVANKIDLRDRQVVSSGQGRKFSKDYGVFFQETSAITNQNVQNTFVNMLEQIHKRKKQQQTKDDRKNQGFSLINDNKETDDKCYEC